MIDENTVWQSTVWQNQVMEGLYHRTVGNKCEILHVERGMVTYTRIFNSEAEAKAYVFGRKP